MFVLINYLKARRVRHQLHRLDDKALKDIGLSRADIDCIANGKLARPDAISRRIRSL